MNDLVVDASALVFALTESTAGAASVRSRLADVRCHAPQLLDAEVGSVARRKVLRGELSAQHGLDVVESAAQIVTGWHSHAPLARLAWSLRDSVSYYDALYAALAGSLDVPLLTCDARLTRAPGLPCTVEAVS